jgi:hypothetical protein
VLRGESRPSTLHAWVNLANFAHAERSALDEVELLARAIAALDDAESLFRLRVRAARAALRAARFAKSERRAATRPISSDDRAAWVLTACGWMADQLTAIEARVAADAIELAAARQIVAGWLADSDLSPLRDAAEAGPAHASAWRALRTRIDAFLGR